MTALAPDDVVTDSEATPAQQAMTVALALAVAAEGSVRQGVSAYLGGRMSRVDLCYFAGRQVLQAMAHASTAGQHLAEVESQHRIRPQLITTADHERIVRAFDTITRDAQKAQVANLASALAEVSKVSDISSETSETLAMRAARIARAEVITAGRTGYAGAVAQAVGDDPDFAWRYATDRNPCGRCVALAEQTFPTFEKAPQNGSHPNCSCTLTAFYRED